MAGERDLKQIKRSWKMGINLPLHREIDAEDIESAIERGNKSRLMKLLWDRKADISEWVDSYEGRVPSITIGADKGKDLRKVEVYGWNLLSNDVTATVNFSFEVDGWVDEWSFHDKFYGEMNSLYERIGDTYYLNPLYCDFYIETDDIFDAREDDGDAAFDAWRDQ